MTHGVEIRVGPYIDKLLTHFGNEVDMRRIRLDTYRQTFWEWMEAEWHATRVKEQDTVTEQDVIRFPDEETALHFKLRWG